MSTETPWEGKCLEAANTFALRCAELYSENPYSEELLKRTTIGLVTDLWDRGFSQTEIRNAFNNAVADLPRYAAGEERNGGAAELTKFATYP